MNKTIIKRNGSKEPLNIIKIRDMINKACEGLKVNPLKLEATIDTTFKNNTKSSDIQDILISNVTKLTTIDEPEWNIVGGRLVLYALRSEIYKNYGYDYQQTDKTFTDYINDLIKRNDYKKELKDYTEKELETITKKINPDYDLDYTIGGALSLKKKYLQKKNNKHYELPQYADMTSAMLINRLEDNRLENVLTDYALIAKRIVSLATPFKSNLRRPNGNTSSCFILSFDDNIEDIMETYKRIALISKAGGGVGLYLGKIRPEDSMLLGNPVANNITLWIKIINDIAIAVNQLGVRLAGITPSLDVYNKDIEDFLELKSEVGELRKKAFDIFPQVIVNSVFMSRIKNNQEFWLVDNHECITKLKIDLTELNGKEFEETYLKVEEAYESKKLTNGKKIKAKDLWKKILTAYIEMGDPYIVHKDNMNFHNPVRKDYSIQCSNLCVESFSPIIPSSNYRTEYDKENDKVINTYDVGLAHTCDLVSINLAEVLNDYKLLELSCRRSVRMLDNAMDITTPPIPESEKHNDFFRTIGVGTLGVADWMAYNKLSYIKEEDHLELEKLYEQMCYWCFDESAEIAKEKGSFLEYNKSDFKKGILLGKTKEQLTKDSVANLDWNSLVQKIQETGIRNMLTFSIAPNTSTSVLLGASASYLPVFSKFHYESMNKLSVPVTAKFIKSRFWYYNEGHSIPTEHIIKLTTRIQKWIDTGISMELIINPEITNIKKISDALIDGFEKGLKTVYYSRTLDMSKNNEKGESGCVSCAN